MNEKLNDALKMLCSKYDVPQGTITIAEDGYAHLTCQCGKATVLLPWRTERRFYELKLFLQNGTLEDLSTLRFCSITSGGCLKKQLAREFDLAVFFTGMPIASVFAVIGGGNAAANVIAKLPDGKNVSIECSNKLPHPGAEEMDRHELIAARGVASDRVVDTQVPQSSVYAYTAGGEQRYTDTDTELFDYGFTAEEILWVRAAFAALSNTTLFDEWNAAFEVMNRCADAAFESDKQKKVVRF